MESSKSVMSLLIGIALDKGQIRSIDDKVLDYFSDYKVKHGEKNIYAALGNSGILKGKEPTTNTLIQWRIAC